TEIVRVKHKKGYWIWLEVKGSTFIDNNGNKKGLLIARDITERKNIEEKLRKSEEMLRAVFETAKDSIFIKNRSLQYIQVNPAMEEMFGVPAEELKNKTDIDLFGKEAGKHVMEVDKRVLNGEIIEEEPTKPIHGIPHTFHTIKVPLKDANGNIFGLCGIARDISERKQAEQKLKESEKKFKALYKGIPIPTYTWQKENDDLVLIDYNIASERITDGKIKNYLGIKAYELYSDQPTILEELYRCFEEKLNFSRELYYYYKSTNKRKYLFVNYAFVPPDLVLVHTEDITEKKRAEQQLKESEEKYRHLFENSPFSILLTDTKGNIMECNSTIEKLYGIKKEEMVGKNYKEILPVFKVSELETFFEDRNKRILEGINPPPIEIPCYIKDGSLVWMNLHSSLVNLGSKKYIQVILQDITERKVAEKELKKLNRELEYKVIERTKELEKSEKKFRQIFESIPDLFLLVDENTTVIDYRGKKEEFFIPPEQFLSEKLSDILPFKLGKMAKEYVSKTISSKQPQILEYSLPMKGKDQYYEARLLFFTENRVAIFIRNITERKWTEEALREEKNRAQKYLDIVAVALVIINAKKEVTLINQKGCEILGYEQKEIVGKNWFDNFIPERNRNEVKSVFQKLIAGKVEPVEYFENPILTNNNEERIIAWHNTILNDEKGNIIGTLSSGEDITERKQIERELIKTKDEQALILKSVSELISYQDKELKIIWANKAAAESVGLTTQQLIGRHCYEIWQERDSPCIGCPVLKAIETGQLQKNDITTPDGRYWFIRGTPVKGADGTILGAVETTLDITERKKAEQQLKESEKKLREQNIELRKLDELKNDFIIIAAHELKT
ncbi:MAG: PAS domain S-box protein, partial [Candidatus Lokiarchaeota archaeon]|nr:PAS domain S-box protein [Candidatus Lokiarchaeota archaeon]